MRFIFDRAVIVFHKNGSHVHRRFSFDAGTVIRRIGSDGIYDTFSTRKGILEIPHDLVSAYHLREIP
jgi:hypothetical protein